MKSHQSIILYLRVQTNKTNQSSTICKKSELCPTANKRTAANPINYARMYVHTSQ